MVAVAAKGRQAVVRNTDDRSAGAAAVLGALGCRGRIAREGESNDNILAVHTHNLFKHFHRAETGHNVDIIEHIVQIISQKVRQRLH